MDFMTFAKKLNLELKAADMKAADLARRLEIDPTLVYRWRNKAKARPTPEQYLKIARIFKKPVEYFIDDSDEAPIYPENLSPDEQMILKMARTVGLEAAMRRLMGAPESRPMPGQSWEEIKESGGMPPKSGNPKRKARARRLGGGRA
jgi:transcriptional regulator with XRE-family HTH domain